MDEHRYAAPEFRLGVEAPPENVPPQTSTTLIDADEYRTKIIDLLRPIVTSQGLIAAKQIVRECTGISNVICIRVDRLRSAFEKISNDPRVVAAWTNQRSATVSNLNTRPISSALRSIAIQIESGAYKHESGGLIVDNTSNGIRVYGDLRLAKVGE